VTDPGRWGKDRDVCAARLRRVAYYDRLGWTAPQIAAELGLTTRTVRSYRARARAGWAPTIGRPTRVAVDDAIVGRVRELYSTGMSQAAVGGELGVSGSWVGQVMQDHGIPVRGGGAVQRAGWETRRRAGAGRPAMTPGQGR